MHAFQSQKQTERKFQFDHYILKPSVKQSDIDLNHENLDDKKSLELIPLKSTQRNQQTMNKKQGVSAESFDANFIGSISKFAKDFK